MQAPKITTAIPKRRYAIGNYDAVLLGDITSGDGVDYRYILAMVRSGEADPRIYVTSEKARPDEAKQGSHKLRIISEALSETLAVADDWGDLDRFADRALSLAVRSLGLGDEQPMRLM